MTDSRSQSEYEIRVRGELDQGWDAWFDGLDISVSHLSSRGPVTTLSGPVADQAALRGMLCKLWDLNLTLISVRCLEANSNKEKEDV